MKDLISVVIPVYNVELYLKRCVDSIINQSYKNIEIFLVNDGSTDSSGDLCDELSKLDKRINVLHKENGGLSDARNYGIEHARGNYIVFVDSDDFVNKKYIEYLYNMIIANRADISVCNYEFYYDDTKNNRIGIENLPENIILDKYDAIKQLVEDELINSFAWNKMYSISLFRKIKYPKGKIMEDVGTTYKLFDKAEKIVIGNKPMYYYYQRSNSILHKKKSKFYIDYFELVNERYEYLKKEYPNMNSNYYKMMYYLLTFYIVKDKQVENYLKDSNIKEKIKELRQELKLKNIKMGKTMKIKYLLFSINPWLYKNIIGGYKCLKKQDYI